MTSRRYPKWPLWECGRCIPYVCPATYLLFSRPAQTLHPWQPSRAHRHLILDVYPPPSDKARTCRGMLQGTPSYLFSLCEDSDSKGRIHYSIDITPAKGKNSRMAKKQYDDETAFRHDIEQDFVYTAPDGPKRREFASLSDERAKYCGWSEVPDA
jgi:hypothetical protein